MVKELEERHVNICVLLGSKKKLKKRQTTGSFTKMYARGSLKYRRASRGVSIMLDTRLSQRLESYTYVSDRILLTKAPVVP